MVRDQLLI